MNKCSACREQLPEGNKTGIHELCASVGINDEQIRLMNLAKGISNPIPANDDSRCFFGNRGTAA